jgi:ornithine carbamoyltransferase
MHLLSIKDISGRQILEMLRIADKAKTGKLRLNKTLLLLFEEPSTRTKISLEAAMRRLGGGYIYVDANTTQMSRGETLEDTARVVGEYVDFIAARLRRHSDLYRIAWNTDAHVINALTDLEHPCQAISDIYTIREAKGRLRGLKLAFVGDVAANTANSLMLACAKVGMDVSLVGPEGYAPNRDYMSEARNYGNVEHTSDIKKGLADADIIYTDTFVSMGEEKDAGKRLALFKRYQINDRMLRYADGALVMHCLPAHRDVEISSGVIDGKASIVWEQARNKMFGEEAVLMYLEKNSQG